MLSRIGRFAGGGALLVGGTLAATGDDGRRMFALGLARTDAALRPMLAAVLPAEAFICLYSATRSPFIKALSGKGAPPTDASAAPVRSIGIVFRNDLGNAAGLDKDGSLLDFNYSLGAGFTVVGTVVSEAHTGNVFEFLGGLWSGNAWTPLPLSGAALNSLGLPSQGIDAALRNIADFRERHGVPPQHAERGTRGGPSPATQGAPRFPIGVSIMGHPALASDPAKKLEGVLLCVEKAMPHADFIEINESCPNVHHKGTGGAHAATDELRTRLQAITALRDRVAKASGRRVPLLVKMGDLGDPKATVLFLSKLGIDGVVALNTQKDYESFELPAADRALLEHYTQRYGGGLSGPPILERSTAQVAAAQAAVRDLRLGDSFTVIHVGGLQSEDDMQKSRATGSELRQWYTGLMHGLAQRDPDSLYARMRAKS
jgi:dihydroorotate dehydrogenase